MKPPAGYPSTSKMALAPELESMKTQLNWAQKLLQAVSQFGNPVRFSYRSIGAPTGRMAAGGEGRGSVAHRKGFVDVNIQSLPAFEGTAQAVNLRAAVTANDHDDDSFVLASVDYSQIELRVAAALSNEPAWCATFQDRDGDIHLTNARLAFNRPDLTKRDKVERARGKAMGFAVLYGAGPTTVAQTGGISRTEADTLIRTFFRGGPDPQGLDRRDSHPG